MSDIPASLTEGEIPQRIFAVWIEPATPETDYIDPLPAHLMPTYDSIRRLHRNWWIDLRFYDPSEPPRFKHWDGLKEIRQQHNLEAFYLRLGENRAVPNPCALQADFLRVLNLYGYGGFALDLDMYCLQPLNSFLNDPVVLGYCKGEKVTEAIIGVRPRDPGLLWVIDRYLTTQDPDRTACSLNLSFWAEEAGLKVYPTEYFIPHRRSEKGDEEAKYRHTVNTHFIHCYSGGDYDYERLEKIGVELRNQNGIVVPQPVVRPATMTECGCYRTNVSG